MLKVATISEILEKEAKVYAEYLLLGARKKHALLSNDMSLLKLISIEEKALTAKLLALESERIKFLKNEGFDTDFTVRELITKLDSPEKEKVEAIVKELEATLEECNNFQRQNKDLFKHSTSFINHMMKTFSNRWRPL